MAERLHDACSNSATGNFHTKKFVADFIPLKLNFIFKNTKKLLFEPPFGGLSGNICTPSVAHWKARGRLPIRHN